MAEGILTEREWRKQASRARRKKPPCWGAQCMVFTPRQKLTQDRGLHALLIMLSFTAALIMPFAVPKPQAETRYQLLAYQSESQEGVTPRAVSTVGYTLPSEFYYTTRTFSREELLRGKLLLIDDDHPLPRDVPAPNTMSVAAFGKGMVPVGDLAIKSGKETIRALTRLFAALRGKGAGGLTVCRGTMTPLEQREWQLSRFRTLAAQLPLGEAMRQTLADTDAPGTGDLQQEYTVEIRLSGNVEVSEKQHQDVILKHTAWRYGFIRVPSGSKSDFRYRYVGEAHATAMTYLDLTIREYLELLHQKKVLQVRRDEHLRYLILCLPMNDAYVEFKYPEGAAWEVSLDNMGYAVMACAVQT